MELLLLREYFPTDIADYICGFYVMPTFGVITSNDDIYLTIYTPGLKLKEKIFEKRCYADLNKFADKLLAGETGTMINSGKYCIVCHEGQINIDMIGRCFRINCTLESIYSLARVLKTVAKMTTYLDIGDKIAKDFYPNLFPFSIGHTFCKDRWNDHVNSCLWNTCLSFKISGDNRSKLIAFNESLSAPITMRRVILNNTSLIIRITPTHIIIHIDDSVYKYANYGTESLKNLVKNLIM